MLMLGAKVSIGGQGLIPDVSRSMVKSGWLANCLSNWWLAWAAPPPIGGYSQFIIRIRITRDQ